MNDREKIMLAALRRAKFIMDSPLIADWVNGAGALDAVNAAIKMEAKTKDNAGIVTSVGMAQDDQGRTVMRAIVDFYDGAAPAINFETVWNKTPVTIVEMEQS